MQQNHSDMTKNTNYDTLMNDLSFPYRLHRPATPDGCILTLLHGSGVDENSLVPFAAEIAPEATVLAVRGRIQQDDGWRWYERITPTRFGQESIRSEADAFADFMIEAAALHALDLSRMIFIGYSNGANLISSTMLLRPDLIRRAALLRAMPVLEDAPRADLTGARILVIAGASDVTYAPFSPALVALLRKRGAEVDDQTVQAGHEFGAADAAIVRRWLPGTEPLVGKT
jgi:phospholipase/carboxylesterase